jgi:hypothetical protein
MPAQCSADLFGFAPVADRSIAAFLERSLITPDIGTLLLGCVIHRIGHFATRFADSRGAELIEHAVMAYIGRPVFRLAPGYEDLIDDELRHDFLKDPQSLGSELIGTGFLGLFRGDATCSTGPAPIRPPEIYGCGPMARTM